MFRQVARSFAANRNVLMRQQIRSQHTLPPLDYPVSEGVAPLLSSTQLDFHYNKHHKTYVDKLNQLIKGTEFENESLENIIKKTAFEPKLVGIFNNSAQHFNHAFYWKCMKPNGSNLDGFIKQVLIQKWGSVDAFKKEFTEKAVTLFGSGWAWLVTDGTTVRIWTGGNAQTPIAENLIPILTVDVWEHAYYLDYQNRRPEYLDKFWSAVNWDFCNTVLEGALKTAKVE